MKTINAAAAIALIGAFGLTTGASANSISSVENARAKDRSGQYVTRQDAENLRRYGGNDDYGYRRYRGYGYDRGYDDGGVGIYFGTGRSYDGYRY